MELDKIDALVPRDHIVRVNWNAWHARLIYDDNVRAHLPRVCKKLFAPYADEPWTARIFQRLALFSE